MLIFIGFISATFLRLNNNAMVERRTAVEQADKSGDMVAVKNNLSSLQRHAAEHMNASSGTVYLEQGYKRDSKRALEVAQAAASKGNNMLQLADETCRKKFSGFSQNYVHCVVAEQAKYPAANTAVHFVPPNPELYRHEFNSPLWSPDFAGFSVLIFLALSGVIIMRGVGFIVLKLLLRKHYSSI